MDLRFSFEGRTERLIAGGRVVLALFSLIAIWLDPSQPAKYAELVYALLAAYVVYALILFVLVWAAFLPLTHLALTTHVLDLGLFSIFMYFTEGPTSPFFVYFIFSILCATLRWQWRGTLWTTLIALTTFIAMGFYAGDALEDPDFELNRLIIRAVYLGMVAVFVGYLGAYEFQHRNHLAKLAAWPRNPCIDLEDVLRQVLEYACRIFSIHRVLMAWEESDEPWLHLAILNHGQLQRSREPASGFGPLTHRALEGKSFFSKDTRASSAIIAPTASFDVQRWEGKPVSEELAKLFEIRSVLSATISGENFKGRLFFLDKPNLSSDDLTLAEVVAGHVATSLELFYFLQRLQQLVTLGERHRLSRDLHDGVLQSLTAGGLRLRAALDLLQSDPATATQQLRGLQDLIVQEQRDLRSFIESLRLPLLVPIEEDFKLAQSLEQLSRTIERQWSLRVELTKGGAEENLPTPLAREIYYIVREGLVNAARHSRGSIAKVELKANDHQVYINLTDDGRGFSFKGDFDHATLLSKGLGPATLKSRIAALGGLLNISSSASGARLQIILPFSHQQA